MDLIEAVKAMSKGRICSVDTLKYRLIDMQLEFFNDVAGIWEKSLNPITTLCESIWEIVEEKKTLSDKAHDMARNNIVKRAILEEDVRENLKMLNEIMKA